MPRTTASLLDQVDRFIRENDLLAPGELVLVGLSGGVDSIVLAHVLHRLGFEVHAAHVNYGLRGEASDDDEAFVRTWCREQTPPLPIDVVHLDAKARAEAEDQSLQEAARDLRYRYFAERAQECSLTRVAVGHHRDDQAETLLLNLVRGSGLGGLAGMAPTRPMRFDANCMLIRPLLPIGREAIEAYAREQDLAWRTDASNRSRAYRRNVIRHEVLPLIEEHFEGATENIAQAADRVRSYLENTVQVALQKRFNRVSSECEAGGQLDIERLCKEPPVWRQRLILEALARWLPEAPRRASVAESVEALLDAQVGRRVELPGGVVWRERDALRIVPTSAHPERVAPRTVPWNTPVDVPGGTVQIERLPDVPEALDSGSPHVAVADADRLDMPLAVRSWQPGDRIRPLGMSGTKTVSDLLTDEQVPPHERPGVLVLCAGERIVWVVGHRLAHDVRIRPETTRAARLAYQPDADQA